MRDSFIMYRSFYEAISDLPKEDKADILDAIFEYSLNSNEIELKGIPKTVFKLIKPILEANNKRYENGNKPKKPKQDKPKDEPQQEQVISETEAKPKQEQSKTEGNKDKDVNEDKNDNKNDDVELPEPEKKEVPEFIQQQQQEFKELVQRSKATLLNTVDTLNILKTDIDLVNQVLRELRRNSIDTEYICLTENDIYKPTEKFKVWYELLVEDCVLKAYNKNEYPKKLGDTKIHVINYLRYQDFTKIRKELMPANVRQPVYEEEYD